MGDATWVLKTTVKTAVMVRVGARDSAAKATADISSKLGADNLEGVDNLCAQLSGVGAL